MPQTSLPPSAAVKERRNATSTTPAVVATVPPPAAASASAAAPVALLPSGVNLYGQSFHVPVKATARVVSYRDLIQSHYRNNKTFNPPDNDGSRSDLLFTRQPRGL